MAKEQAVRISPGIYEINGKRVNAPTAEDAMKKAGVQKGAAPAKGAKAQGPTSPLAGIPKKIKNVNEGVQASADVADVSANKNIGLNNPTQIGPFGRQDTTLDANGNPVVTQSLDPNQQHIVDQDAQLSSMGRDYASSLMRQGGLDQQFDPTLDPRTSTGDFVADRKRQEGELSNYLSRDFATNKAQERSDLETSLYNRGIPLDPQAEAYKRSMKQFDDNWNAKEGDVRAQALKFGGEEMDRSFNDNEQRRANQLSEQGQVRQQRLGEVSKWSGLGPGAQLPQFQGYQGPDYKVADPNDVAAALTDAQLKAKQLKIQQQQVDQAGKGGGGGAPRAGNQPVEQSPFVDG